MANIEFTVLMLGARRTGKSSILASMLDNFQKTTAGADVTFSPKGKTIVYLQKKKSELQDVFNQKTINDVWEIDQSPTFDVAHYSFNMNIIGNSNDYTITFVDIPGEYINNEHIEEVAEYVLKSCVIIIAIDTPHLLEENGKFNEAFNKVLTLYNLFISDNRFYDLDKMILFVPLKCEKYYHEKRMEDVKNAVKREYGTIIRQLGNPNIKNKFTMAITPILTMGDVIFSHFGKNSKGLIETYTGNHESEKYRPKHVYYKFRRPDANFSPTHCEQPLIYTLSYIYKFLK
jgi:GTPase SAR1 family protein